METIRQLNDHAISCMQQDLTSECKALLSKAIELLQMQSLVHAQQRELQQAKPTTGQQNRFRRVCKITFRSILGTFLEDESILDEDDADFHFFPRPFVFDFSAPFDFRWVQKLPTHQEPPPEDSSASQRALCCAACLYNLALAYHVEYYNYQRSMRTTRHNRDALLDTAYQIYESAFHILLQLTPLVPGDSVMLLFMAVCSNLAAVGYTRADLNTCWHWKQQLTCALKVGCQGHIYDDHQSLQFFVNSASLPDFHSARAA